MKMCFHNLKLQSLSLSMVLFITISFILLNVNYCELNYNNRKQTLYAMKNFRFDFHDFEPRYALQTQLDKRKPRGFQFHADNHDFNVELEFIVPFIRIPIERSMFVTQSAFRSLLNLNIHSLLTTGAIVAIGGIIFLIFKIIFTRGPYYDARDGNKSFRNEDDLFFNQLHNTNNTDYISYSINKLAAILESKLQENNINYSHCVQSSLCSYTQQNFCNNEGGLPRIMDGIFSLDVVRNYINGTAIKYALDSARNGDNCSKVFSNCSWPFFPSNAIMNLFTDNFNFINIAKSTLFSIY